MFEHYRQQVQGTTIDPDTLLSTDYFNLFNEVIMLLGLVADMPDMLDEVDGWEFRTYAEHFKASALGFAMLAIEAYPYAPESARRAFEQNVEVMKMTVEEARMILRDLLDSGETDLLTLEARNYSERLQALVDTGSAIVHGAGHTLDQSAIDDLF